MSKGEISKDLELEKLEKLKDQFNAIIEDADIESAIVIFKSKKDGEPNVLRKGHFYDIAKMLNYTLNAYKQKIAVEVGF